MREFEQVCCDVLCVLCAVCMHVKCYHVHEPTKPTHPRFPGCCGVINIITAQAVIIACSLNYSPHFQSHSIAAPDCSVILSAGMSNQDLVALVQACGFQLTQDPQQPLAFLPATQQAQQAQQQALVGHVMMSPSPPAGVGRGSPGFGNPGFGGGAGPAQLHSLYKVSSGPNLIDILIWEQLLLLYI
jgi:hypothetical protein